MKTNDTQALIGKLLGPAAERDAIHIAVLPVVAAEDLRRGQRVKLVEPDRAGKAGPADALGIVDPFLEDGAAEGDRFFLFLYPNTVTGMRHHWQHPAVSEPAAPAWEPPTPEARAEAGVWLREFADRWRLDYDEMVRIATDPDAGYEYITAHGRDLHGAEDLGEDHHLFWEHLERLTGRQFTQQHRGAVGWSCSC